MTITSALLSHSLWSRPCMTDAVQSLWAKWWTDMWTGLCWESCCLRWLQLEKTHPNAQESEESIQGQTDCKLRHLSYLVWFMFIVLVGTTIQHGKCLKMTEGRLWKVCVSWWNLSSRSRKEQFYMRLKCCQKRPISVHRHQCSCPPPPGTVSSLRGWTTATVSLQAVSSNSLTSCKGCWMKCAARDKYRNGLWPMQYVFLIRSYCVSYRRLAINIHIAHWDTTWRN